MAYSLGGGEAEIRDQKVEVDAEIPGCGDPAAGQGMAKPLDTSLQSIHTPILALRPWGGGGVESGGAGDDWRGVLTGAVVRQRSFAGIGLPCEHELQLLSTVQRSSMRMQGSLKDASVRDESATSIAHRQTRRVRCVEDQAQSSASSWPNSPWSSLFIPYRFLVETRQFAGAFQPGPVRALVARCQLLRDLQLYVPMVWRTSACWARLLALLKYRRVAIRHLRRWPRGQTPQSGVRYRWCHPSGLRRDCAMRLPPAPEPAE